MSLVYHEMINLAPNLMSNSGSALRHFLWYNVLQ